MSELRLGDVIDDHCTRCRMLTNHSVVAIVDSVPAKVECRTCYHTHKYRHGKGGAKTAERVPTTTSTAPRRMRCH